MFFIETSIFIRQVTSLLTDDEYSQLQVALVAHPEMGTIIPHSGVCEKYVGPGVDAVNAADYEPFITGSLQKIKS